MKIILQPKAELAEVLVSMRNQDIETTYDSAAERALTIVSEGPKSTMHRRGSVNMNVEDNKRNVAGREIQQGHEQYALTYGMMLGIRVMTGRYHENEPIIRESQKKVSTIRGSIFVNISKTSSSKELQTVDVVDEQQYIELTEKDFTYAVELKLPPEGALGGTVERPFETPPHKLKNSFKFKDYVPKIFRAVRAISGVDESEYMLSVAGDTVIITYTCQSYRDYNTLTLHLYACTRTGNFNYIEFIANSKSGQFFFYTYDGKYMIKTQTKEEAKLLREMMPEYLKHLHINPDSLLCRIYGMHRVKMRFLSSEIHFVIMASVFDTHKPIHVMYDLKGSTLGRITSAEDCAKGAVQKDLNLIASGRKLRLGAKGSQRLASVLKADVSLLTQLNVMDYSLLIGINESNSAYRGKRFSTSSQALVSDVSRCNNDSNSSDDHTSIQRIVNPEVDDMASDADANNNNDNNDDGSSNNNTVDGNGNSHRSNYFKSYHGGIQSLNRKEVYYMGIIDILQLYNTQKRAETFFKSLTHRKEVLSSVDAKLYGERFLSFVISNTDLDDFVD